MNIKISKKVSNLWIWLYDRNARLWTLVGVFAVGQTVGLEAIGVSLASRPTFWPQLGLDATILASTIVLLH